MKLKKVLLSLITVLMSVAFIFAQGASYTVNAADELYIGYKRLMQEGSNPIGYAIGDPKNSGVSIWNLVKYSGSSSSTYSNTEDIYCLKEGRNIGTNSNPRNTYNWKRNMKTQKSAINTLFASDTEMKKVLDGTMTINGKSVNRYNAILAILDNIYLFNSTNAEKTSKINDINREALDRLMDEGHDHTDLFEEYPLTPKEIKAVQQVAIWYFTEDGTQASSVLKSLNGLYSTTTESVNGYENYVRNNNSDYERLGKLAGMNAYFKNLIEYAKNNASNYANASSQAGVPAVVNTNTLEKVESGNNYIIGPIKITQNSNAVPYTIDFAVKNKGTGISYTLLDQNKASTSKTVKQLVGNNFYISIPKTTPIDNFSIDIKINYTNTTMNLWTHATTFVSQQPVVELTRTTTSVPKTLTFNKKFDLALRKYITKVNGVNVANSRVPNVNESTLTSGATASN